MANTMLRFRTNHPSKEDFWHLFSTTGWNDKYHASADELMLAVANSWYVVSAYLGEELVGFGRVVTDQVMHAMIFDLIVDPAHQNRGIGSQILNMLVKKCLDANIRDIQLFSANEKQTFYEKRGFVARPREAPGMEYRRG